MFPWGNNKVLTGLYDELPEAGGWTNKILGTGLAESWGKTISVRLGGTRGKLLPEKSKRGLVEG